MHVEDLDISPSKIAETAQRIVDRAHRRSAPARARAADQRASVSRVRAGRMGHVRRSHARRRAEPAHHSSGDRRAPAHDAVVRRPRAARVAGDQARLQAGAASRQPRRPADHRGGRPVLRRVRGNAGRSGVDPAAARRRARGARRPARRADARHGAARRAAEEALRAAAVPQALRDQPEPAGAAGQAAAGVRPRQGNPAGARDPLPPRARQLRDAHRRAGRRQDGHRRRAGAADRVRAGNRAGPAARLPGRQPADEHDGRRARCCAACSRIASRTSSAS